MRQTLRRHSTGGFRAALVAALFAATMVVMPSVAAAAGPAVFINEIHYDNAGADVGEFVEIAGPAGTDLSGWSVAPYNGSNGTVYSLTALSGTIPDQQGGFGAVSVAISGLQNGAPDGLALVDSAGGLIEFLSYEGSFAATNGPASGMTSVDIGVSESSSTAVGESLQLTGNGTMGGDFTWSGPSAESPGEVNNGQTFSGGPTPPIVVINEVDYDQPGSDTAEFVELKNVGSVAADLDGFTVEFVNGNGAAIYDTIALPAVTLAVGEYFVICANSATVVNCDLDDGPDINFIQNGSPDAIGLRDLAGALVDAVSYEGDTADPYTEGSGTGLEDNGGDTAAGLSRCEDGVDTDQNNVDFLGSRPITPGATNDCTPAPPTIEKIHDIQGNGTSVAISGPVGVQGIVTSLFERDDALDAFFVQEEDSDADADPETSEGIYVFCRGNCPSVATGDLVTVTGEANEFFGMSQIDMGFGAGTAVIESSDNALPTPVNVSLPATGSTLAEGTFESTEGMIVSFPDTLVVSEYFQLARFGQIVLTESSRPYQFTHNNAPSVAGYDAFQDELATRRIILDDDNNDNNDAISDGPDEPYYYPEGGLSLANKFRGGDTIDNLTGVMHWSFAGSSGTDAWRIRPVPSAYEYTFASVNPEPASPDDVGGRIQVASFNVLNYFTTVDAGPNVCGPSETLDCRGADSEAELARQRAKIVAAMVEMDAEVLGLIEIENDDDASVADLVAGLNAATAAGTYDYIRTGFIGTDAIKLALVYKPALVSPVGDFAVLDASVDPTFLDSKNRPVLIQTFEEDANGARFTVAVNHLKSKGSACDDVGDPDRNDGQASCPGTRTAAATALANYLATDPTGSGDPDFLIIGDLNSYAMEDPITALTGAGYTDLLAQFGGPEAYSYVFDGQLGYLDHALANGPLLSQVSGTTAWNINADEVAVFDYNDDIQDAGESSFERESGVLPIYAPDPFRSSDHDPVLIGLELDTPMSLKLDTIADLSALLPTGNKQDDQKIEKAIERVEQSLNPAWWINAATLDSKNGNQVFDRERQAVQELEKVSTVPVQSAIDQIVEADRWLAQRQLDAAIASGGNAKDIAKAQDNIADAVASAANGDYAKAVQDYKKAWQNAVKAL